MFQSCRNCGQPRKKGMSVCVCGYDYDAKASEVHTESKSDNEASLQGMHPLATFGLVLICAGTFLMLFAYFGYGVTVDGPEILDGEIINIGLLQNQLMLFQGSCTIILVGSLLACTGWLLRKST